MQELALVYSLILCYICEIPFFSMAVNDANVMKTSPGGRLPILQDFKHGCGFIHRLDVPSSGLVLAATTYVPRLQERVSESGMLWCWDEPLMSSGTADQTLPKNSLCFFCEKRGITYKCSW